MYLQPTSTPTQGLLDGHHDVVRAGAVGAITYVAVRYLIRSKDAGYWSALGFFLELL